MNLSARIMNLAAKPSGLEDSAAHIYRIGYRDARHAAADLAAEADAIRDELVAALESARISLGALYMRDPVAIGPTITGIDAALASARLQK